MTYIKRLYIFFVISSLSTICNAQIVRFGIRGGMNISAESDHRLQEGVLPCAKFKIGANIGGAISFLVSNKVETEADILYSMQGFKDYVYTSDTGDGDDREDYVVTSHYLNIPVVIKYFIIKKLHLECGPQIGLLLSKKHNQEETNYVDNYGHSNTKKIDFSMVAGIGYNFNDNIFINARYSHGLTGTSKIYNGAKNRNIQISLGYMF